jgi:hypothetical protein
MIHQGEVSAAAILALIPQGARRARYGGPYQKTVVKFKDPPTKVRGVADPFPRTPCLFVNVHQIEAAALTR